MTNLRQTPHPAPVIVFGYNRPAHLRRTVASLLANPQSADTDVYFFCDGAKRAEHEAQVQEVRSFVDSVGGFRSVTCVYRNINLGLAASVIDGVTHVLASHGRAIVVEDDLLLAPHFLQYMNDALECYANDTAVASIHGYCYPTGQDLPSTFFIKGADCWGWATWSRAWAHFERDGQLLLEELRSRGLTYGFDFEGSHPYTAMLEGQIAGRNDSWAVRWYASCFLKDMLTLYPGRSLVENIGNDGSGTHASATTQFVQQLAAAQVRVERIALEECAAARKAFKRFFGRTSRPSTAASVGLALARLFGQRA